MTASQSPVSYAQDRNGFINLNITVSPAASRNKIKGIYGDTIKIAVTAPPEHGKANAAIIDMLADTLDVNKKSITIIAGLSARRKSVQIQGITLDRLITALGLS
jgi:uncharacterized protein